LQPVAVSSLLEVQGFYCEEL